MEKRLLIIQAWTLFVCTLWKMLWFYQPKTSLVTTFWIFLLLTSWKKDVDILLIIINKQVSRIGIIFLSHSRIYFVNVAFRNKLIMNSFRFSNIWNEVSFNSSYQLNLIQCWMICPLSHHHVFSEQLI